AGVAFDGADIDAAAAQPNRDRAFGDQVGQGQLRELLRHLGLEGRIALAEHALVLGPHPGADIAMGDDDRAGILEHLVAPGMIQVIVRVHQIADRLWRDLADFVQQGLGGVGPAETVHHQYRIVTDDDAGVRSAADRGIDPRTDFLQGERGRLCLGRGREREKANHGQGRAQYSLWPHVVSPYLGRTLAQRYMAIARPSKAVIEPMSALRPKRTWQDRIAIHISFRAPAWGRLGVSGPGGTAQTIQLRVRGQDFPRMYFAHPARPLLI